MHVLDNGICVTCQPASRSHVLLVDGMCVTCNPVVARFDPLEPREPHSGKWVKTPGGGSRHDVAKKLLAAIDDGDDEEILNLGEQLDKPTFDALTPKERKQIEFELDGTARGKAVPKDRRDRAKKILEKLNSKSESPKPQISTSVPKTTKAPAKAGPRVKGRDRFGEVTPDNVPRGASYPVDEQLTAIAKLQGFDGRPHLTDAEGIDRAVAGGWTEMWRGVQDSSTGKTARQIADDLKRGSWELGNGVYGNGVYASVRRATAEQFSAGSEGGLIRMALDPHAKIIDFHDLIDEMDADRRITPTGEPFTVSVLSDPGRYAAAKGYDVVRVPARQAVMGDGSVYGHGEPVVDQFVILNRTALIVQEEDPA